MVERDPTEGGRRIRGDEQTAEGEAGRARYRWAAEWIRERTSKDGHVAILDFGCGTGYGTHIMERHSDHFIIDSYDPGTRPWIGSPIASWDAIVALDVLHHMDEHPRVTTQRLRERADLVVVSTPYCGQRSDNAWNKHRALTERSFPAGCCLYWQSPSGQIVSTLAYGERPTDIILTWERQQ